MPIVRRGIPATSQLLVVNLNLVLFLLISPGLSAQIAPDHSVDHTGPPGTYWSLQRPDQPPLPYNPFPELPVYTLDPTNHIYAIDDSTVNYPALSESLMTQNALAQFA